MGGVVWFCRKDGLMKGETCSVHTMDGHLMDVDHVLRFRRLHLKVLRLVPFGLQEHVLQGFLHWCLKAYSLFGQMRMDGKELMPLSLPCS